MREKKKRVNSSLDKLRTLLPYQANMKKDMASLLEQTVEYMNVMHKVLNESDPECLGKVYTAYREKTEEIISNRKTMKKMMKRKLKEDDKPGSSGAKMTEASGNNSEQIIGVTKNTPQRHGYYESTSQTLTPSRGSRSQWPVSQQPQLLPQTPQNYHQQQPSYHHRHVETYNQVAYSHSMVGYAQNPQPISSEARQNSGGCPKADQPSWSLMNPSTPHHHHPHQYQPHMHVNGYPSVLSDAPLFQEYTPPCLSDHDFDPSKMLKDANNNSSGTKMVHLAELSQQQQQQLDPQQQAEQRVYHDLNIFKAPQMHHHQQQIDSSADSNSTASASGYYGNSGRAHQTESQSHQQPSTSSNTTTSASDQHHTFHEWSGADAADNDLVVVNGGGHKYPTISSSTGDRQTEDCAVGGDQDLSSSFSPSSTSTSNLQIDISSSSSTAPCNSDQQNTNDPSEDTALLHQDSKQANKDDCEDENAT